MSGKPMLCRAGPVTPKRCKRHSGKHLTSWFAHAMRCSCGCALTCMASWDSTAFWTRLSDTRGVCVCVLLQALCIFGLNCFLAGQSDQMECQKMSESMSKDMSERMSKDMSESCQKECQNICQKEFQKTCQKAGQKICQKECQKICQKECQKICQKECQKTCQKAVRKNVRTYVRKNFRRYVKKHIK